MPPPTLSAARPWTGPEKIAFRFFFIYYLLFTDPLNWLPSWLGMGFVQDAAYRSIVWTSDKADLYLFHIRQRQIPLPVNDGAGDTSAYWAQICLFIIVAAIGCLIWSLADRRRRDYHRLGYWFRTFVRYYIALISFSYGILKLFALQMSPPSLSQLATPLGDFGPMRLYWLVMGISSPYEIFAGIMEITVGLLLLYRRTVTLGLLAGAGVYLNVMMLNLSYDVPVKAFAMNMVIACMVLLVWDYHRLLSVFVLDRPIDGNRLYEPVFTGRKMNIVRLLFKTLFVITAVLMVGYADTRMYLDRARVQPPGPIHPGIYAVNVFARNGDTIPPLPWDSVRWKDVIFDKNGRGSINGPDTGFSRKYGYGRGLFAYQADPVTHMLKMRRSSRDTAFILQGRFEMPDSNTVRCWARLNNDSLYLVLQRVNRQFQLAGPHFHWISESNR